MRICPPPTRPRASTRGSSCAGPALVRPPQKRLTAKSPLTMPRSHLLPQAKGHKRLGPRWQLAFPRCQHSNHWLLPPAAEHTRLRSVCSSTPRWPWCMRRSCQLHSRSGEPRVIACAEACLQTTSTADPTAHRPLHEPVQCAAAWGHRCCQPDLPAHLRHQGLPCLHLWLRRPRVRDDRWRYIFICQQCLCESYRAHTREGRRGLVKREAMSGRPTHPRASTRVSWCADRGRERQLTAMTTRMKTGMVLSLPIPTLACPMQLGGQWGPLTRYTSAQTCRLDFIWGLAWQSAPPDPTPLAHPASFLFL